MVGSAADTRTPPRTNFPAAVGRRYRNGTGAGPPGTRGDGTCVFRSADLSDPTSLRGWNGTAWSTQWVNPYEVQTPESELWRRTCQDVSLSPAGAPLDGVSHLHAKRFAGPLAETAGWPSHVILGLAGGSARAFFPAWGAAAPFTAWVPPEGASATVKVEEWTDPCAGISGAMMYPNLLDADSPFNLSAGGDWETRADGLSYGLVSNRSLYLYYIVGRQFILRVPVAWFAPGQTPPRGPFLPPTRPPRLNPAGCGALAVAGGDGGVDGVYRVEGDAGSDGTRRYRKDVNHFVYHFQGVWVLGRPGAGGVRYYELKDIKGQGKGVPESWGPCYNISVRCVP